MFNRVVNTTKSMSEMPDTNDEGTDMTDVNGAPGAMDEDGELDESVVNDDQTSRIYSLTLSPVASTEHTDCTVLYAAPHGQTTKRKIFTGPVTAYQLASALIDVDSW